MAARSAWHILAGMILFLTASWPGVVRAGELHFGRTRLLAENQTVFHADIDGDGIDELITVPNNAVDPVRYLNWDHASDPVTSGTFLRHGDPPEGLRFDRVRKIEDLDGSGKPDLVISASKQETYQLGGQQVTEFRTTIYLVQDYAVGERATSVPLAQEMSTAYSGPGYSNSASSTTVVLGGVDVDLDGRVDLLALQNTAEQGEFWSEGMIRAVWFQNPGDPSAAWSEAKPITPYLPRLTNPVLVDMDHDGDLDFAFGPAIARFSGWTSSDLTSPPQLIVYENMGDNSLEFAAQAIRKPDDAVPTILWSKPLDMNHDGLPDILAVRDDGNLVWYENSGSLTLPFPEHVMPDPPRPELSYRWDGLVDGRGELVPVGDPDGDGYPDLAICDWLTSTSCQLRVLHNVELPGGAGRGFEDWGRVLPTALPLEPIRLGDFDGDGQPDVLAQDSIFTTGSAYPKLLTLLPPGEHRLAEGEVWPYDPSVRQFHASPAGQLLFRQWVIPEFYRDQNGDGVEDLFAEVGSRFLEIPIEPTVNAAREAWLGAR